MGSNSIVVIVLAAGKGLRFAGTRHKLEQRLGGSSVLGTTLSNALASKLPVIVVTTPALGPSAQRYMASRDIVLMEGAATHGMGDSIAAGVAARAQASGWIVLPADMPLIQARTIAQVGAALESGHPVVYAQHRGRRGHPVGFAGELFSELAVLSGDEGARRLLGRYPTHGVEVHDSGVLADIDTTDDLAAVRRAHDERQFPHTASGPLLD